MRVAVILVVLLLSSSCTVVDRSGEEVKGLPTAETAAVLRGVADDLVLLDTDGVVTGDDLVGIVLALTTRFLSAARDYHESLRQPATVEVDR